MDFELSDSERAFRDDVRAWLKKLYEAGYVGITWPEEYGGRGRTFMDQLIFNDEMILAHAPEPINVIGLGMGGPVVIAHSTDEQKRRYLPPLLSAEEIWCQGFSEPN